ncbi:hypothetical protein CPAR01_08002 [Colletotrichum paranaense]|uniref:Uncharacterized protein n=7 Tax=Colletotrichum acutatum species complex TaxID=2707335 RepID=A0A9Q0B482_9PEZI|nr:uncharacterized protein CLUP02_07524 [Colletotrichum lupini]XP_060320039.1 uncharacterized protein CCOS01_00404 [Colletotrichum costaricense]XP_060348641.1 uncharacterized protein CPAR01_08002 [Colletotrichum paranaense]XP_060378397.1 uncharacterized protein CTAM01_10894 [Colletotrichum tamarilloi]XP_060404449.1 uncharacterized protein CABS01_06546 [Colletotrichum abscissum]KAI3547926.1 hypothetical protein CSPX01_03503 [Colletotrichum filicis]KAK0375470.1 hypothetical protein CLIM01_07178
MAPSNARVSVWCKLSRRGNSRKHRSTASATVNGATGRMSAIRRPG